MTKIEGVGEGTIISLDVNGKNYTNVKKIHPPSGDKLFWKFDLADNKFLIATGSISLEYIEPPKEKRDYSSLENYQGPNY